MPALQQSEYQHCRRLLTVVHGMSGSSSSRNEGGHLTDEGLGEECERRTGLHPFFVISSFSFYNFFEFWTVKPIATMICALALPRKKKYKR